VLGDLDMELFGATLGNCFMQEHHPNINSSLRIPMTERNKRINSKNNKISDSNKMLKFPSDT
jgi:hypothetical protein